MKSKSTLLFIILVSLSADLALADPLTTAFSYQGRLTAGANPAIGSYDFQFHLCDALAAGNPVSTTNSLTTVVSNGLFTVALDFGLASFTNTDRWLEIAVRTNGEGAFTTLSPRQQITPAPYAIFSANAGSATAVSGTFSGNLAGGTNLNGANIQPGTVNSNALDAATQAQLALAGMGTINGAVSNMSANAELQGFFVGDMLLDQSVNLDKLSGFWNTASAKLRPARVLLITDYSATDQDFPGVGFEASCASVLGANGGLNVAEFWANNVMPGQMSVSTTGGNYDSLSVIWPFTAYIFDLTNGAAVLWGGSNSTTSLTATKVVVLYVAETNAGTFSIQTNLAGAGWGNYMNINAAAYGTNLVTVKIPLVKGNYQLKAVSQTGRVRLIAVGLWDDTSPGIRFSSTFTEGQCLYDVVNTPTNYWWPVFSAINPDLIVIEDGDQALAANGANLAPIYFGPWAAMLTNCCPNANIMWLGVHHLDYPAYCSVTNQSEAYNTQLIANALQYNWMYWDPNPTFGTNTAWMIDLGVLTANGIHPTVSGAAWLNRRLFNSLIQTKVYANQLGTSPLQLSQLPGVTTNVVCGSRTLLITNGIIMGVQ